MSSETLEMVVESGYGACR